LPNVCDDKINYNEIRRSCSTYRIEKNKQNILVLQVEGKKPLGRTKHRYADKLKERDHLEDLSIST
jgi:hypothetical protein